MTLVCKHRGRTSLILDPGKDGADFSPALRLQSAGRTFLAGTIFLAALLRLTEGRQSKNALSLIVKRGRKLEPDGKDIRGFAHRFHKPGQAAGSAVDKDI